MSSVYKGMAAGMCCMPHHKQRDSIQQGLRIFVAAISLTQPSKLANKKTPPKTKKPHMHAHKKKRGGGRAGGQACRGAGGQGMGTSCQGMVPAARPAD